MTQYNPLELNAELYEAIEKDVDVVQEQRKERLAQVVSKFSSTLLSRQINVSVGSSTQLGKELPNLPRDTEAWSDAENIWFNADTLGDLTDLDTALAVRGLSLHEIAHILLTPRAGSNIVKWVRNNQYDKVFNILEDQRIELMLTAKYSNVKHWFTASVAKYLLSKPKNIPYAHVSLHGRTFLPAELRKAIRDAFQWPGILSDVERIINSYTVLNLADSSQIPVAMQLIKELHELLTSNGADTADGQQPTETQEGYPGPNGIRQLPDNHSAIMKSSERSKPANKASQQQLIDRILRQRNQQTQESDGKEEGEEYESESSSDSKPSSSSSNNSKTSNSDNDDESNDDPNNNKNSNGQGGAGVPDNINDVTNVAQRQLNKTKQLLRDDLSNMVSQFNGEAELTSKKQSKPERSKYERQMAVAPDVINQVKSFVSQLHLIRSEHDPGWLRKVNTGKLNVYRYMTGSTPDEVFDLWDDGREDVLDIEAVILLDNSGSMNWTIDAAHDSMWAIKRSLDKVGASTTVMTFADDARMLYDSTERAKINKKYVGTAGGTDPNQAVRYAKYVLANSDRAIKILIVITDGVWWGAEESENAIAQMRRAGVITALGYVDYQVHERERYPDTYADVPIQKQRVDGHGAEIVVTLNNGSALLTLAKALVKAGIKRNLNK